MPKKKPEVRGIEFDTTALKYSRKVKNKLTQQQLANNANIDVATVGRAEKGEPVQIPFAEAIANALGEQLIDLVKKGQLPPPAPIAEVIIGPLTLRLYVDKDYKPPYEPPAIAFLIELYKRFNLQNGFDKDKVNAKSGSLIIEVPVSRQDAATLTNAFIAGELEQFDISAITIIKRPSDKPNRSTQEISPDKSEEQQDSALRSKLKAFPDLVLYRASIKLYDAVDYLHLFLGGASPVDILGKRHALVRIRLQAILEYAKDRQRRAKSSRSKAKRKKTSRPRDSD